MRLSSENSEWLAGFRQHYGRAPRVLHIGNIANNAYLNSKILRASGIEADVLCYNYSHIMGCPEWEECELSGHWGDDFNPRWKLAATETFRRPDWFYQGALRDCTVDISLEKAQSSKTDREKASSVAIRPHNKPTSFGFFEASAVYRLFKRLNRMAASFVSLVRRYDSLRLVSRTFACVYPERRPLTPWECANFDAVALEIEKIFPHYDLIHAYATDPIIPFLSASKPYVAYEHGTIRHIPFADDATGKLTAIAYKTANHCLVTNCDNIQSVAKLGIERFSFIPHPVNESYIQPDQASIDLRKDLCSKTSSDFIVLHPSRQHWTSERHPDWEKGNDRFIEGFAAFVKQANPRALAVMVNWGKHVKDSKALADSLGIEDRIVWVDPLPNRAFIRYIHAADAVADQFYLGAFGSLTPKAMACSKPALLHLDTKLHAWAFKEMPPVVNVCLPEEISRALEQLYRDPLYKEKVGNDSRVWYEKYHSNRTIADSLVRCYRNALESATFGGTD